MKKIMITALAVASCMMAAVAQEQDSTRQESNEYRGDPSEVDSTMFRRNQEGQILQQDSVSQEEERESTNMQQPTSTQDSLQQDANQLGNELRQGADEAEQEANEAKQDAEEDVEEAASDVQRRAEGVRENAEQKASEVENEAENTGSNIRQDVEHTKDEVQRRAMESNNQVDQGTEQVTDSTNVGNSNASDSTNQQGAPAAMAEIGVVEDKEGPNNEVVYEYQGKLWYVDREKQQLVEANQDSLKSTEHKVMVKEGTTSKDPNRKGKKSGK